MSESSKSYEIRPNKAFGAFRLGDCLTDVIKYIQKESMKFRKIRVCFDEKVKTYKIFIFFFVRILFSQNIFFFVQNFSAPIILHIDQYGMRLIFDVVSQRLKTIDIFDVTKMGRNTKFIVFFFD